MRRHAAVQRLAPRTSRPNPALTEIRRRIAEVALDNPSDLMRRARPDYGSRFEPPCCFSHEFQPSVPVDRLAQRAQYVQLIGGEARHEAVLDGRRLKT
jgi:hypothetical protein